MADEERQGLLDGLVRLVARVMDSVGLNGSRLLWKWNQRKRSIAESSLRSEIYWRQAKGRHKMCPACRSLVPRGAATCPECGEGLGAVKAPGVGRAISNLLPGRGIVTSLILLVNGFWFLMLLMAQARSDGGGGLGLFVQFSGELLFRFGSGFSPVTLSGEWWRLITPVFLHGGLLHFFFNSFILLQLGPLAEEEFGPERFWVIYLACGIAGSAVSQFLRPVNTVGASGAILGLMGLLLVHGWRSGGVAGQNLKRAMGRYAMYVLLLSLLWRGVDHLNHAGGFACGALLGLIVPAGPLRGRGETTAWQLASLAGVLLVLLAFAKVAGVV